MLKKIYIDNFKCYTNFELSLDSINLLLGENGSGKSTLFDVLNRIKALVATNLKTEQVFFEADLTRWQKSRTQRFELEVVAGEGTYRYELTVAFDSSSQPHIHYERLWFDNNLLLRFETGMVQLYRDDFSPDTSFPFDRTQSAIAPLPDRQENSRITLFREYFSQFIVVRINPLAIDSLSERENSYLAANAQNFVSWYRHVSNEQGIAFEIREELKQILSGFQQFKLVQFGEQRRGLEASFSSDDGGRNVINYRFHELSDGERTLIVLYTLLHFAKAGGHVLCIDEPENFLALPEIQPWLMTLYDFCSEGVLQAVLISHHPELIDYLAATQGIWFERESNSPVRVKRIQAEPDGGLPISELVARGWING